MEEYYTPRDFQLGKKVNMLGYDFLLVDCDPYTKEYYKETYPDLEMIPVELPKVVEKKRYDGKKVNRLYIYLYKKGILFFYLNNHRIAGLIMFFGG